MKNDYVKETQGYARPAPHLFRVRRRHPKWLVATLLLGAAVLLVVLLLRALDYGQARQEYKELAALVNDEPIATAAPTIAPQMPSDEAAAPLLPTVKPFHSERIATLKKQNTDTVAWIDISGTDIAYPVVQGADNTYYETHSFSKKRRAAGAIFVDAWNTATFTDFNTVIYGHHMKDGSMFSKLREYRHDAFLRTHKYIDITLEHSLLQYKVFAAYECGAEMDFRGFGAASASERNAFLGRIARASVIATNAQANAEDRILTLVTCTGGEADRYWVVHAVLINGAQEVDMP